MAQEGVYATAVSASKRNDGQMVDDLCLPTSQRRVLGTLELEQDL